MTGTEETREGTERQPMEKKNKKSKKKYLIAALAVCLLLLAAGFLYPCIAPMHIPYSLLTGFSYTVYSDHVELEEYKWNFKTVRIPDSLWGRPVTVIGECCFLGKDMKKVVLPEHLQVIGDFAFKNCKELTDVFGGEAVSLIGGDAFYHCESLNKFEPGENVEEIGDRAFEACYALSTFSFAKQMKCIGAIAFAHTGLTDIPDEWQVDRIYNGAFSDTPWMEQQTEDFVICGGILLKYNGRDAVVRVPEGVRGITYGFGLTSFQDGLPKMEEVYLPDTVEYVTADAFCGRENLRVYIPASVEEISGIYWWSKEINLIGEDTMTIITTAGSAAEAYAKEMGLACEIVEGW